MAKLILTAGLLLATFLISLLGYSLYSFLMYSASQKVEVTVSSAEVDNPDSAEKTAKRPIRIAMSAAFVSESGVDVYQKITDYLAAKTDNNYEMITGLSYSTINSMLEKGTVDAGFICGLPYVLQKDSLESPVELLVAPIMINSRYQGKPIYFSDLIVHKDSKYKSIHDLRGTTYVFNEETSNSGYNMPLFRLAQLDETNGFFGKVLRSGSHEESIRMVATGQADASFVDSLVIDFDRSKHTDYAKNVRVLESIGPAGIPPVVISKKVAAPIKKALQHHLLNMHLDPEGRKILDEALVDRFVNVSDENYDDIRRMKKAYEAKGFTVIK